MPQCKTLPSELFSVVGKKGNMITFIICIFVCSFLKIEVVSNIDILQIIVMIAVMSDLNLIGHIYGH